MLGHTYRYHVYNGTGVSVTATVKERAWKYASDGSRTDASEVTPISSASVSAGAYSSSSAIDNSSGKNLGAHILATLAPGSSATGSVSVYLQHSTDGGTSWPSNGKGLLLGGAYFSASSTSQTINCEV